MNKKLIALLAATVVIGLNLGYGVTSASGKDNAKSSTPQKEACCGHCAPQKKAYCGHCGAKK